MTKAVTIQESIDSRSLKMGPTKKFTGANSRQMAGSHASTANCKKFIFSESRVGGKMIPSSHTGISHTISFMLGSRPEALHIYLDRKSTRTNSSHYNISYAVFCLKKK